MVSKTLFSSRSEEWATPQKLFDYLNQQFHFTLDAAATAQNAKCPTFYTKEQDGLLQDWTGNVWLNPPYGRQIYLWMQTAYRSAQKTADCVVVLVHARTDTKWWHEFVMRASEVWFLERRVAFVGKSGVANSSTFPSVVVVFRRNPNNALPQMRALKKAAWA